jgi:hypothetical protein
MPTFTLNQEGTRNSLHRIEFRNTSKHTGLYEPKMNRF